MDADCVNLNSYAVQQVIAVSSLFSLKHLNDEKLQSVLGHFQKYFDGGVIVENQGAAFGGYGSFLPMHQRCPLVKSDPKTPQISQNYNRPRDEDELLNKLCPQNLELRWQTEVSSSIYATPLVADINRQVLCWVELEAIDTLLALKII
ncbi:hypothetical protein POM88_044468 [Heracleum sosnowskyi]|uniref:Uncharacterized protein n=1 Tax=Heracleum sosnowskyi TaxID=360622 RepID=A0AAD8H3X5_9APIA|nr:hypothetical protein POM88_044468 [Heracleum sosnowskyi]